MSYCLVKQSNIIITHVFHCFRVDHWDNDKEKLVMLTDHSLIVNKYDFITLKVSSQKRIFLHMIDTVKMGDFIYPSNSLMWYVLGLLLLKSKIYAVNLFDTLFAQSKNYEDRDVDCNLG